MGSFKNEFSWSISRDRIFQTCPRQYYYNYYGYWGGWEFNAPQRVRQIYGLNNIELLILIKDSFIQSLILWLSNAESELCCGFGVKYL